MTYNVFGGTLNPTLLLYYVIRSWEFKYNSYLKCLLNKLLPEIKRDDISMV